MPDLPRQTFEESAKPLKGNINDLKVELQVIRNLNITLTVVLTDVNIEVS